ncbi:MAG: PhoX family phosphatase [Rhodocyclaceae bacterium]|jgi:secreted PhoX family phosphatase|nr:PhoX family phosphatase [Rhodocyclaceae bacterium]
MSSKLHPDGKLNPCVQDVNPSGNESILDLIEQRGFSRRGFLKSSVGATAGATAMAVLGGAVVDGLTNHAQAAPTPLGGIGFSAVPPNVLPMTDGVTVPAGYRAEVLVAWGDALVGGSAWDPAGPMTEAAQIQAYGAHTDGMHYFPFPGKQGNHRGLLVTNSEYCDPGLVNSTATYASAALTLDMVRAQQAAHGVNVVDVKKQRGEWGVHEDSAFNRRITGNTPCRVSGPAAGHALMRTAADSTGKVVLGTLNNCSMGYTPWGTYLTCEENFNGYFGAKAALSLTSHEKRYGLAAAGFGYRWHEVDGRFDINEHRNEANRFGWVVEIDPWDPDSTPVKRTALGRFKHESAGVVVGDDYRVVVYMGDDERNEYVYKFVCAKRYSPRSRALNRDLLDSGTLYVARFNADGSGQWLPLVWGQNGLTPENGFADQGEVVIKCRQAADRLGATMMDRPEWVAIHPTTREVYLTLTNNSRRGNTPVSSNKADGSSTAASANPPVDAANPRPDNDYGHIIRWRESGGSVAATTFQWDIFVQCGDSATSKTLGASYTPGEYGGQSVGYSGNINGDDYGAPDGLWFDQNGRLWIQTDQPGDAKGDWGNIGGNMMLCADPSTGETRRFLTSPPNSEVTGVTGTPDGRTMFVGIQHPGEDWSGSFTANSSWPDNGANGATVYSAGGVHKPRSGVVVITKDNGGVIGT